jgi:hypothetical protein
MDGACVIYNLQDIMDGCLIYNMAIMDGRLIYIRMFVHIPIMM